MVEHANCVIALRSDGVSLVLDISNGQLPAILHWGADLGTLELADVEALILSKHCPRRAKYGRRADTAGHPAGAPDRLGRSPWSERLARRPCLVTKVHDNRSPDRRRTRDHARR
jgi:hypothetical protein